MTKIEKRLDARGLLEACEAIAMGHNVIMAEVCSRARTKRISEARQAVWEHLRTKGFSYPEIGRLFDRDHTTILAQLGGKTRGR